MCKRQWIGSIEVKTDLCQGGSGLGRTARKPAFDGELGAKTHVRLLFILTIAQGQRQMASDTGQLTLDDPWGWGSPEHLEGSGFLQRAPPLLSSYL